MAIVAERETRSRSDPQHRRDGARGIGAAALAGADRDIVPALRRRQQLRTLDHRMIMDLGGHDRVWREILKPFRRA